MKQLAEDFRATSQTLYELLAPLPEADFSRVTQFKDWTITDVLIHLLMWNQGADQSLAQPDAFKAFITAYRGELAGGLSRRDHGRAW